MPAKQPQKRKPLYRRAPTDNFRLQARDKEIIFQIYKHRFLNSRHITALVEGSDQRILRRLNVLFHANFLARPLEQIRPYKQGSDPMVYGIGNEGAKLLEREFKIPRGKVEWTRKNREVKQVYLEHTLMVANFMVCLEVACKSKRGVELVTGEDLARILPATKDKEQVSGWKLAVERKNGNTKRYNIAVVPDKVFALYFPNDPPGKNKALFFLEADRSTMPVIRSSLYLSSFFKKLVGYWESYQQNLFQKYFGLKGARVLTVAKSVQRVNNIIAANKQVDSRKKGSKMFLFATQDSFSIESPKGALEKIWRNGRDNGLDSLLD